jgi:NitT/TauT family transport system ATP-binding protein
MSAATKFALSKETPMKVVTATPGTAKETAPDLALRMQVSNLNFYYGKTQSLFNVNVRVATNQVTALIGPSGCGKSTVLRIIAGLKPHFPATSGQVLVLNKPVTEPGPDRGLVDQKYSMLPHLNVIDNVAFGLRLRGVARSERLDRASEWVKKVGLEGSERKYPSELSGGMQQRVAIAATLILQPRILLMDEPFGALDPGIRLRMQELLIQLWNEQQSTVFLVTHSVEEAVYLGDRVFLMAPSPGRLVDIMKVPRPAESPEESRRKPWFINFCQALLQRLEEESPAPHGVKV